MHTTATATIRIDETLHAVAARLSGEIDDLVETMLVRMRDEAPGFDTASRPELADGLRASCYGNARVATALGGDRQPPQRLDGGRLPCLLSAVGMAGSFERWLEIACDKVRGCFRSRATHALAVRW